MGATVYMVLVFFKHIYLYAAPIYFTYCVSRFLIGVDKHVAIKRLLGLAGVVIGVTMVAVIPLVVTGQFGAALSRLFPFGRGLVHSYWAPNFWALYLFTDRVLGKLIGVESGGVSSTSGLVQVTDNLVLPNVSPQHTLLLTLVCYFFLLLLVYKRSQTVPLLAFVGLGNAVCFMLGWHIHEKAILMVYYPLLVFSVGSGKLRSIVWTLSVVACASLLPLMPRGQETILKWILCVTGSTLDWIILKPNFSHASWMRIAACIAIVPEVYRVFIHGLVMKAKYEFFPLMMNSVVNSVLFAAILFMSMTQILHSSKSG
jgi:alpha-1,3-glucosyltransferase